MTKKIFTGFIIAIAIIFNTQSVFAAEIVNNAKINIQADEAITYPDKKILIFSGNVKAVRGDTLITAKKLTIFYKDAKSMNKNLEASSFEKIEAFGDVVITMEDKIAKSEKAIFLPTDQKLILSGNRPTIQDTENKIEGDIITYFMKTGGMEIKHGSGKQVEATFTNK